MATWGEFKNIMQPRESGGDYNALFSYANRPNGQFAGTNLTNMSIDQLLDFSNPSGPYAQFVKGKVGRVATPMGANQIVGTTLRDAKSALGLSGQEKFTPEMQDSIGEWIYKTQGPNAWASMTTKGRPDMEPLAQPTAATYDPMDNLSKSQRMMLAFGALRDAGAALTGQEGRAFATTMAGINEQQDMSRKAQAAARQQEFMQGLGGLTGSSVGVDTGTPDFQGQKQQVLQAAAANLIDGPTAKLYIDEINANAAKFTAKGLGPSVAAEGQAGRKPINEMSVAELDQYATEIAPLSANQDMKDFVTTTLGQIKTQRENKMGQEKSVGQASNMLSTIDSILSDEGLGDVVGTGGIWSKALQGVGLGSLAPSAARALSKIQQIQGQTFLQAYEGLRGGGQITEIEGKKAEAALARLNTDQSPKDFKAALGELRVIVENGMKRARGENVEEYTGEETPSATGLPKVRVYDPTTGTFK